jgi:hypothetical protein
VVVYTARLVVEHLGAHLAAAFVKGVHQAADLQVVGAREFLLSGVEVIFQCPSNKTSMGHRQLLASRRFTSTGEKFCELVGSFFFPKGSSLMWTTNLKYLFKRQRAWRRRRACNRAANAIAATTSHRGQLNPPWSAYGESWVARGGARIVDVWR